jgi:hypothetical protein
VKIDWAPSSSGNWSSTGPLICAPRLQGLTDEEYFWEPVEGCWTLRRGRDGAYVLDAR